MARAERYNDDPALAPVPLSVEEAARLVDDPDLLRKRDIPHLLGRLYATTVQVRDLRRNYDDELRRRTAAVPRPGLQATLSPEQAAKFLSPDQLSRLFDRYSQERLDALDLMRKRAAEDYDRLQRGIDDAVSLIVHALASPGLDAESRSALSAVVDELRSDRERIRP